MSETKRERNRRKSAEFKSKAHDKGLGKGHEKHHDDPPPLPPPPVSAVPTPVSAEPVVTIVPDSAEDVLESMKDFTWNKKQKKQKKQKKTRRDFDDDI